MRNKIVVITTLVSLLFFKNAIAQVPLSRIDSIQVEINSKQLKFPWAGGVNFAQFSDIDLDLDGIKDLVVFDRTGNKIATYINGGTANTIDYDYDPKFEKLFPQGIHDWMLLVDFNCDGKEDIFTYSVGGFAAYKNISTAQSGLKFQLIDSLVKSFYPPSNYIPLYVSAIDIPAFFDVDDDGDLDVVTFNINGIQVEYHKNKSKELFGHCDSLKFELDKSCFGMFTENQSNCGVNLNACTGTPVVPLPSETNKDRHSGSCLLCLELSGDKAVELLVGDLSCCHLTKLNNGGTSSLAQFTSFESNFPSNTQGIDQQIFPCPYHLDVNNDNVRDLLISPNAQNVSENITSVILYNNTGTEINPVFNYVKNNFLQDDMIDIGEGAYPQLFDYNSDGLNDLIVSNLRSLTGPGCTGGQAKSSIYVFENTGTKYAPKFKFITNDYQGISALLPADRNFYTTFGDLDNDGDEDMIVGDEDGNIHFFKNTAGSGLPAVFALQFPIDLTDNNNNVIDVGTFATPQLYDLNKDGLLDLITGDRDGNLTYLQNVGTSTAPLFKVITTSLGGVDVMKPCCTGYSTPVFFSDSGKTELFVGSEQGYIYHYTNIDNNLTGTFTLSDSMFAEPKDAWPGSRIALAYADITGDSLNDMIVGNYRGGMFFYIADIKSGIYEIAPNTFGFSVYPNPANGILHIRSEKMLPQKLLLSIIDITGKTVLNHTFSSLSYYQNIPVEELANGVYVLQLSVDNITWQHKLVITGK